MKEKLIHLESKQRLGEKLGTVSRRNLEANLSRPKHQVESDSQIQARLTDFMNVVRNPIATDWSAGVRADTLQAYIDSLARAYHIEPEQALSLIPEWQRGELLSWLRGHP